MRALLDDNAQFVDSPHVRLLTDTSSMIRGSIKKPIQRQHFADRL